ncbi:MAG TPA: HepT-like ribonuclease domain-containing protein [Anaerolineae bacterium]
MSPKQLTLAEVQETLPELRALLLQHNVHAAYLFGSILDNGRSRLSDLDVAVLPPPDLADWFIYYNDLHAELCRFFQSDNVDLVLLDQAPLALQARVLLEGQLIIQGGDYAEHFSERILARYVDTAGWRQENWQHTQQLVRHGITSEVNMIDQSRVERFVHLIRDAVRELKEPNLAEVGLETYQADKQTRALSEHYLRLAIEATLDLSRHIIVKTGLGVPQEYREVGKILREQGVVPPELGRELELMAGMRNVLVHLYWDIDYTLLYQAITTKLDVFEETLKHLFRHLDEE